MIVKSVFCRNFRNIENGRIEPSEGINLLYGANAEGKTNALEGIYMFACGRSFRGAKEKELIRFGQEAAMLRLEFSDARRSHCLEIRTGANGRRAFIKNGVPMARLSEFVGCFRAVLFCPQHLDIIKSGPGERRQFTDSALTQLYPDYVRALQRYSRILRERNSLIKSWYDDPAGFNSTVGVWNEQLSAAAEEVAAARFGYVERLNCCVKAVFSDMTGGREVPELRYTEPKTAEEYRKLLENGTEREIKAGVTLYGPHRDDITVRLNGSEARLYASQGQQRSIALAMKLGEGEISEKESGECPVFLFDDVLSELDSERRSYLLGGLKGKQVIMTSCEEGICSPETARFEVKAGSYTRK